MVGVAGGGERTLYSHTPVAQVTFSLLTTSQEREEPKIKSKPNPNPAKPKIKIKLQRKINGQNNNNGKKEIEKNH